MLRWRTRMLGLALLCLGAAVLVKPFIDESAGAGPAAAMLATQGLLVAAVIVAFAQSVPARLLRVDAADVVWGVLIGCSLVLVLGWLVAMTGDTGFPALADAAVGWSPVTLVSVAGGAVVSPLAEEFFFRGVVLVALYRVLHRWDRRDPALLSVAVTSLLYAAFVWTASPPLVMGVTQALLGVVCSSLVMATGRIWGAVTVHLCFGALYAALQIVGAVWG